jgi:hypothetical protein
MKKVSWFISSLLFYIKLKMNYIYKVIFISIFISSCDNSSSAQQPPTTAPLTNDQLLNMVQGDVFKYFWDYAEPNSKLARERYHVDNPSFDQNIVTTGGSGFGLMTILVGIERGFVSRSQAVSRLNTALTFLENADRFHGAWPHWLDGTTGNVIPFGNIDNGGDLVETAFLCQGLLCVREYFKNGTTEEQQLATKADNLWKGVEWDWYTKGENALYWHWSPNYEWQMNFKLEGYNECLITYALAAASPTYPIAPACYHQTWARNGNIVSSASNYGLPRILNHNGTSSVGPLFWAHYSYLGLDPRGLTDAYANYWNLNVNHTKIIYNHCVSNPNHFGGYSNKCWGLTASYTREANGSMGYTAHQPNNDNGVISPTAALSSMPYTPNESLAFLRFLYEEKKNNFVGIAGPYDAFSIHYNHWTIPRYLAIDQGTIAPMIENYRTGLLWNLFMQAPEVKTGLQSLGFSSTQHGF